MDVSGSELVTRPLKMLPSDVHLKRPMLKKSCADSSAVDVPNKVGGRRRMTGALHRLC